MDPAVQQTDGSRVWRPDGLAHVVGCLVWLLLQTPRVRPRRLLFVHSRPRPQVQILVRKVRNKAAGTIGDCVLEYERINGR